MLPDKDEEVVVFCLPCTVTQVLDEAEQGYCSICFQPVWVAPSSRELQKSYPQARLVCRDCAPQILLEAKASGDEIGWGEVPGAVEEIREQLRKDGL